MSTSGHKSLGLFMRDMSLRFQHAHQRAMQLECAYYCTTNRAHTMARMLETVTGDPPTVREWAVIEALLLRGARLDPQETYALVLFVVRDPCEVDSDTFADEAWKRFEQWRDCGNEAEQRRMLCVARYPHIAHILPPAEAPFWSTLITAQKAVMDEVNSPAWWVCWWDTRDTIELIEMLYENHKEVTRQIAREWVRVYMEKGLQCQRHVHSRRCPRGLV